LFVQFLCSVLQIKYSAFAEIVLVLRRVRRW